MLVEFFQKNKVSRRIIYHIKRRYRAAAMVGKIERYLNKNDRILDIGAGTCNICEILIEKGLDVTPLDVKNLSFVDNIKPIIYGGNKIPFEDNSFDVALILAVLHHLQDPEKMLLEAKRVSRRIVIIEDIYTSPVHKYITNFTDSLLNLQYRGNPHTNKSDSEWKLLFNRLGLKLKDAKYTRSLIVFRLATYYLEKTENV